MMLCFTQTCTSETSLQLLPSQPQECNASIKKNNDLMWHEVRPEIPLILCVRYISNLHALWGLMAYYSSVEKLHFFHLSRNLLYTEEQLVNLIDKRVSWSNLDNYTMHIRFLACSFPATVSKYLFEPYLPLIKTPAFFNRGQHTLLAQWNTLWMRNFSAKPQAPSLNALHQEPGLSLVSDERNTFRRCQFLSTMRGSSWVIWVPERRA